MECFVKTFHNQISPLQEHQPHTHKTDDKHIKPHTA